MSEEELLTNIEKYRDQLYRFAVRTLWDSSAVDDVFASMVLAAYENRDRFQPGTNFRAWIFRILVNKCFIANRELKRAALPLDEDIENQVAAERNPLSTFVLQNPRSFFEQCGDEVFQAFRRLSTAQRACILLKDVERFSYREIAETLGIPVGTVMTHLARGRAILRKELLEYAQDRGIVRAMPRLVPRTESAAKTVQASEG